MNLGELLTKLRRENRVTVRKLQEATGISNSYLSQLEMGRVREPSPNKLYALANYYKYSYSELMKAAGYVYPEPECDCRYQKQKIRKAMELIEEAL